MAEDLAKSRWDMKAREAGQWKWHRSHHPDAGDAANYAIGKYISIYTAPPKPSTETRGEAMQRSVDDDDQEEKGQDNDNRQIVADDETVVNDVVVVGHEGTHPTGQAQAKEYGAESY